MNLLPPLAPYEYRCGENRQPTARWALDLAGVPLLLVCDGLFVTQLADFVHVGDIVAQCWFIHGDIFQTEAEFSVSDYRLVTAGEGNSPLQFQGDTVETD